jgi:DNA-binding XRE family transcriptional regulator
MTTTKNRVKNNSESATGYVKACLVTDQISLTQKLLNHWNYGELKIKERLADLIGDQDCGVYIIDTAVKDMDVWPVPFLTNPDPEYRLWLFLVSNLADTNRLEMLPEKARFYDRDEFKIDDLLDFIKKQLDPESGKRIGEVLYLDNLKSWVIHMENGRTYILKVSYLPEADSSQVASWTLDEDHRSFKVVQKSGNWFDVPWDDVLYHCEPGYAYYKGRHLEKTAPDCAQRIGQKIRQLRIAQGYSIEALARKAGMKRPNLSRLESGKHQPSLETLENIAGALGVTIAEILAKSSPG